MGRAFGPWVRVFDLALVVRQSGQRQAFAVSGGTGWVWGIWAHQQSGPGLQERRAPHWEQGSCIGLLSRALAIRCFVPDDAWLDE
jgi:hypothetical protein